MLFGVASVCVAVGGITAPLGKGGKERPFGRSQFSRYVYVGQAVQVSEKELGLTTVCEHRRARLCL